MSDLVDGNSTERRSRLGGADHLDAPDKHWPSVLAWNLALGAVASRAVAIRGAMEKAEPSGGTET